ncbi:hypothetical protein B0A55_13363, partial [Friedmanniomyces simplex]
AARIGPRSMSGRSTSITIFRYSLSPSECGRNSADWMVFVCNAVVELKNFELAEGLERTLTINVVSTYLLAIAVLPKLQETADTHSVDTRLTLVGSIIHVFAPDKQL